MKHFAAVMLFSFAFVLASVAQQKERLDSSQQELIIVSEVNSLVYGTASLSGERVAIALPVKKINRKREEWELRIVNKNLDLIRRVNYVLPHAMKVFAFHEEKNGDISLIHYTPGELPVYLRFDSLLNRNDSISLPIHEIINAIELLTNGRFEVIQTRNDRKFSFYEFDRAKKTIQFLGKAWGNPSSQSIFLDSLHRRVWFFGTRKGWPVCDPELTEIKGGKSTIVALPKASPDVYVNSGSMVMDTDGNGFVAGVFWTKVRYGAIGYYIMKLRAGQIISYDTIHFVRVPGFSELLDKDEDWFFHLNDRKVDNSYQIPYAIAQPLIRQKSRYTMIVEFHTPYVASSSSAFLVVDGKDRFQTYTDIPYHYIKRIIMLSFDSTGAVDDAIASPTVGDIRLERKYYRENYDQRILKTDLVSDSTIVGWTNIKDDARVPFLINRNLMSTKYCVFQYGDHFFPGQYAASYASYPFDGSGSVTHLWENAFLFVYTGKSSSNTPTQLVLYKKIIKWENR